MNAEKQVRNEFLTMIQRERWERNELYFQNQLKLNNMDIQQRYFVCCASIKGDCFIEAKNRNRTGTAILQYERAISNMTSEFQTMVFPHKPIVVYQASTLALLLPCTDEECRSNLFGKGAGYIKKVTVALSHLFGSAYLISIGGYASDITKIHECCQRYEMLLPEAEQEYLSHLGKAVHTPQYTAFSPESGAHVH